MEPTTFSPEINIHTATIDALVAFCSSASCETLGEASYTSGRRIVKVSEQAVIKFGIGVAESEANNQRGAYRLLDPSIVRVPEVYRFFTKGRYGYIVMEYIKGQVLDPLEDQRLVHRVAYTLAHLAEISCRIAGPLESGVPRGLFWPDNETLSFNTIIDIEIYFNSRLAKGGSQLDFGQCRAVLCHLDVAPRNILWQEDGTICLIDWECAGFYPRVLEVCAQRVIFGKDGEFNRILLEHMAPLTEEEEVQANLIMKAYSNSQRYHFPPFVSHRQYNP